MQTVNTKNTDRLKLITLAILTNIELNIHYTTLCNTTLHYTITQVAWIYYKYDEGTSLSTALRLTMKSVPDQVLLQWHLSEGWLGGGPQHGLWRVKTGGEEEEGRQEDQEELK